MCHATVHRVRWGRGAFALLRQDNQVDSEQLSEAFVQCGFADYHEGATEKNGREALSTRVDAGSVVNTAALWSRPHAAQVIWTLAWFDVTVTGEVICTCAQ
jgi:hypothetical protein